VILIKQGWEKWDLIYKTQKLEIFQIPGGFLDRLEFSPIGHVACTVVPYSSLTGCDARFYTWKQ